MKSATHSLRLTSLFVAALCGEACVSRPASLAVVPLSAQAVEGRWRSQQLLEGDDLSITDLHDGRFRVVLTHHSDVGPLPAEETTAYFDGGYLRLKEPPPSFNGRVAGVLIARVHGVIVLVTDAQLPELIECASGPTSEAHACLQYCSFQRLK